MKLSELRYSAFGEVRYQWGSLATDKRFTGQRAELGFGVYDYGARFYSPLLGRFISPDSVVPGAGDPQAFNRYAYSYNNPLKYTDPSGHVPLFVPNGGCSDVPYEVLDAISAALSNPATGPVAVAAGGSVAVAAGLGYAMVNAPWDDPTYEAYPLSDASQPEVMTTPMLGGDTTTIMSMPLGDPTGVPLVETLPYAVPSQPLVLANPLNPTGSNNSTFSPVQARIKNGSLTEPVLPPKTMIAQDGVTIEHYYRSGDHGPAHLHVTGQGSATKIGQNGKPIAGSPELSPLQQRVIRANRPIIRKAIDKIQRWNRFNEAQAE